jgi:thiamine biosynthesis lipoprotein
LSLEESIPGVSRFCHQAMATTFEIYIQHNNRNYAEQAAYAAFDQLDALEGQLSRFINGSDISQINNLKAGETLSTGLDAFECLELCRQMDVETEGAFDMTFGSSVRGYKLKLNKRRCVVQQPATKVIVDLGGIGKGFTVDKMSEVLSRWGIEVGLIVAGFSSVLARGAPKRRKGWPVTLRMPDESKQIIERLYLKNRAIGASGLVQAEHVIDPRTGGRVKNKLITWAVAPMAGVADALSTAFMVMRPEQIERYCREHQHVSAIIVAKEGAIQRFGIWEQD